MTRKILLDQLAKARKIGDHAAEIMLLARIRKEAADARPEPSTAPTEPTAGWSELEKRWAFGDR